MFRPTDTATDNVAVLDAIGTLTDPDDAWAMIPLGDHQMKSGAKWLMLLRFGPDFKGNGVHDLWDRGLSALRQGTDFRRIAILSDRDWITSGLQIFSSLFPRQLRIFLAADAAEPRNSSIS